MAASARHPTAERPGLRGDSRLTVDPYSSQVTFDALTIATSTADGAPVAGATFLVAMARMSAGVRQLRPDLLLACLRATAPQAGRSEDQSDF